MIDDLIDALERTHAADGVTLVRGAKNLVAQGYADDISSPSGTRAGLQRIINSYNSHLARWKGVVNIDKSCTLTFNPDGAAADSTGAHVADDGEGAWHWNGTPLPHVHKIKYLGLESRVIARGTRMLHARLRADSGPLPCGGVSFAINF